MDIYTRRATKKLFYVLLLTSCLTILYFYSGSTVLNNVSTHSTVVHVDAFVQKVFTNKQIVSDIHVSAYPETHAPDTSSSSSTSLTTTKSLATRPTSPTSITNNATGVHGCVHFDKLIPDTGVGLGNLMFNLAAVVYVANLTGRQPGILKFSYKLALDEVFDLRIKRFDDLCPCYKFYEDPWRQLRYDIRVEDLVNVSKTRETRSKSIDLTGFFQSWKYTRRVGRQLRQHFTFLPEIRKFVDEFMAASRPPGWLTYVRVSVHVRRGDVLLPGLIEYGYTTPDKTYFAHAMRYFVDRFKRIQFIVASTDISWCRENFAEFDNKTGNGVNVTYLTPRSRGEDFAILASCDHVIMSTGTYGWWAAWLVNGTTIYYKNWPRPGSKLASKFRNKDFFPPRWIGMS